MIMLSINLFIKNIIPTVGQVKPINMQTHFVNLKGEDIRIIKEDNELIIKSSGLVEIKNTYLGEIEGVPISRIGLDIADPLYFSYTIGNFLYGQGRTKEEAIIDYKSKTGKDPEVTDLWMRYIVPHIIKDMFPNREDLCVPAEEVFKDGKIIGYKSISI